MTFKGEDGINATPNPRRLQFGLRTSLVLLAVVPMALGLLARVPAIGPLAIVTAGCFVGGVVGINAPTWIPRRGPFWIELVIALVVLCGVGLIVAFMLLASLLVVIALAALAGDLEL